MKVFTLPICSAVQISFDTDAQFNHICEILRTKSAKTSVSIFPERTIIVPWETYQFLYYSEGLYKMDGVKNFASCIREEDYDTEELKATKDDDHRIQRLAMNMAEDLLSKALFELTGTTGRDL